MLNSPQSDWHSRKYLGIPENAHLTAWMHISPDESSKSLLTLKKVTSDALLPLVTHKMDSFYLKFVLSSELGSKPRLVSKLLSICSELLFMGFIEVYKMQYVL
jgi:hypothetical protein